MAFLTDSERLTNLVNLFEMASFFQTRRKIFRLFLSDRECERGKLSLLTIVFVPVPGDFGEAEFLDF